MQPRLITKTTVAVAPHTLRCRAPHNPMGYWTPGGLKWCDVAAYEDTRLASLQADSRIRRANVVSVGRRQDAGTEKFLGLRPDVNQHLGTEQLEWSVRNIEFDGKAVAYDPRDLVVHTNRQRCRFMVRPEAPCSGFQLSFDLGLTGLTCKERAGEYWLYSSETGAFRFRIRKPAILDPKTAEPLLDANSDPAVDLVEHSLTDGTYTKTSTPAFEAAVKDGLLPNGFLIDADIYYGATADGHIAAQSSAWSTAHDAASGIAAWTTNTAYGYSPRVRHIVSGSEIYDIYRSFFLADTSAVSIPDAATWYVKGYLKADGYVSFQLGTQGDTLAAADFDAFSGSEYGHVDWYSSSYNSQAITASDVNTSGYTKLCLREYTYDYLNSAPALDTQVMHGCNYADQTGTTADPYLEVTDSGGSGYTPRVFIFG